MFIPRLSQALSVLVILSSIVPQTSAQKVHNSLYFSDSHFVQKLQIVGDYISYEYTSDNGKFQRKGQVRISDLNLADTIVGGEDVFGIELKCKNRSKCLDYAWIDARVKRGEPVTRGANSMDSVPLSCRQKEECVAFLAALRTSKGDDFDPDAIDSRGSPAPILGPPSPEPESLPTPPTTPAKAAKTQLAGTRIYFKNSCGQQIHVAITYQFDDEWLTGGWWNVDPGKTAKSVYTTNPNVYFYANRDDGFQWDGRMEKDSFVTYTVPNKFTMSTQFPLSGGTRRIFFHRTAPERNTSWTMEFTCPE